MIVAKIHFTSSNDDCITLVGSYAQDLQNIIDDGRAKSDLVQLQGHFIYLNYDDGSTKKIINFDNVAFIDFIKRQKREED